MPDLHYRQNYSRSVLLCFCFTVFTLQCECCMITLVLMVNKSFSVAVRSYDTTFLMRLQILLHIQWIFSENLDIYSSLFCWSDACCVTLWILCRQQPICRTCKFKTMMFGCGWQNADTWYTEWVFIFNQLRAYNWVWVHMFWSCCVSGHVRPILCKQPHEM